MKLAAAIKDIPMPKRVACLPRDARGFPVPWFVTWFLHGKRSAPGIGEPDFRIADTTRKFAAIRKGLCWICGERLGKHLAFCIGPMCAINRVSSEPPAHLDCAIYSAKACPFLSKPAMRRNEKVLPNEWMAPAGHMIARNPGVALIWVTPSAVIETGHEGGTGLLYRLGDPSQLLWFAEGRPATRDEVFASIESGLPSLQALCDNDDDHKALADHVAKAMPLINASLT